MSGTGWFYANSVLDTHIMALPTLGDTPIVFQNEGAPNQVVLYLATHFMPATVEPELWGGDHEKGTYQISVFIPVGQGTGPAIIFAQAVVDHFKRKNLDGISCGVPTLTPPIQEPDWWHVVVSVPFIVL